MRKGIQVVTKASDDKWQRYEQALLVAMGFEQFPTSATTACYQLLIISTFHAPCCLRLVLTDQDAELSFSLLVKHATELFNAIWREHAQAEVQSAHIARQSCIVDNTHLNAEQATTYRRQLALLEPMTLGDVDLSARDGLSIRCDCSEQNRQHRFTVRSPTAQDTPRHTALVSLLVEAAQAHFQRPQIQGYLVGLQRYFH